MQLLTYGTTAIVLFFAGYIVGGKSVPATVSRINPAQTVQRNVAEVNTVQTYYPKKDVWEAEESFETTMRSCLGSFCFDDAVKSTAHKDVVRVGLLMPDNIGSQTLINMLHAGGLKTGESLELIYASNVPPYGYGKNHGWSRIIRISNHIIPHSVRLLESVLKTKDLASIEKLIVAQVQRLLILFSASFYRWFHLFLFDAICR